MSMTSHRLSVASDVGVKDVTVAVAIGQSIGASAADPDLVNGTILGYHPSTNQDAGVDHIVLGENGAVTVTLRSQATAENVFGVSVLRR